MTEKMIPQSLPIHESLLSSLFQTPEDQKTFFTLLSEHVGEWSRYNFGAQSSHRPAMGMVEELNELKLAELRYDRQAVLDAIGDVTVYMADYFSIRCWDLGVAWSKRIAPVFMDHPSVLVAYFSERLSRSHLKGEQGIRGGAVAHDENMKTVCSEVLWYLLSVSNYLGEDYIALVSQVWAGVSKRDWKKNRNTAHQINENIALGSSLIVNVTPVESTGAVDRGTGGVATEPPQVAQGVAEEATSQTSGKPILEYEVGDDEDEC